MEDQWIIAAAGKDADRVRRLGFRCLHLCTALTASGQFSVLSHPLCTHGDLLGIVDQGGRVRSAAAFAAEACSLAMVRGFSGLLADFQRSELSQLAAALDSEAYRCGLSCWIPLELASAVPHSMLIAETAVSGGSLALHFADLQEQYGAERIAAQLVRSCSRFTIPSASPAGTPLRFEEAEELRRQTGAVAFFSRELCAKYYTYTAQEVAYFVLFDDKETLRAKQTVLSQQGVAHQLLLYPDASEFGLFSET